MLVDTTYFFTVVVDPFAKVTLSKEDDDDCKEETVPDFLVRYLDAPKLMT